MLKKFYRNFARDFFSDLVPIGAANVSTMKKTRGFYHVSEGRYLNFSPVRFSEIVAILTAPAVLINVLDFLHGPYVNDNVLPDKNHRTACCG